MLFLTYIASSTGLTANVCDAEKIIEMANY